jgi:hypothetical protein
MGNMDVYIKKPSRQYCSQFGKIAVGKGFVTAAQLKIALDEQVEYSLSNRRHRFVGCILFEHGWITGKQIDIIVNELYEHEEFMKWDSMSA